MDGRFKAKDYSGKQFGLVTAISRTNTQSADFSYVWKVKCACGKKFEIPASRFSKIYSCGCRQRHNTGRHIVKDLSNFSNYMAKAIAPTSKRCKNGYTIWKLRCGCGRTFERPAYALIRKTVKSCGCRHFLAGRRPPLPDNKAHINVLYSTYKKGATIRNKSFELSRSDCIKLFESNCFYCNAPPKERKRKNLAGKYANNGIDRVDSELGYIPGNVVACCSICNFAKSKMSLNEFFNWVKRLYDYSAHLM